MTDDADLRVQLAAYLAGELDDDAADRLEDRMHAEPWVAAAADRMAEVLVELGGVDAVEPPEGYGDRLRAAVAAETGADLPTVRGHLTAAGAAAATGWADRPGGAHRGAAAGRRQGWTRLQRNLAVAAGVAVLAVAGVGVLSSSGFLATGGSDEAALESADDSGGALDQAARGDGEEVEEGAAAELDADTADEEAAQEDAALSAPAPAAEATEAVAAGSAGEAATFEDAPADAEESSAAATASAPAPAGRPAVLDLGELSAEALRRQVGEHPATQDLYGVEAGQAPELADAYRDELLRGPGWADGTPAGVCLAEVLRDAGEGLVPAVAARGLLDGAEVVAYGLVRSEGGAVLDRTEVWVLDPGTCDVRRVLSATSE